MIEVTLKLHYVYVKDLITEVQRQTTKQRQKTLKKTLLGHAQTTFCLMSRLTTIVQLKHDEMKKN